MRNRSRFDCHNAARCGRMDGDAHRPLRLSDLLPTEYGVAHGYARSCRDAQMLAQRQYEVSG